MSLEQIKQYKCKQIQNNTVTPRQVYTLNNEEGVLKKCNERILTLCKVVMDVSVLDKPSDLIPAKTVNLILP
jgi:hypothetical protein